MPKWFLAKMQKQFSEKGYAFQQTVLEKLNNLWA